MSAEPRSSGRVKNEDVSANRETILNNVKQDMLEHIKSLEDEQHVLIGTLKREIDVIKNQNDIIRQENDLIQQQNIIVTKENDDITNEIDLVRKEHGAISKVNDAIGKENAELRARLFDSDIETEKLISRGSGSDEQVNVLRSCMQVIERQCDIRIRDMETTKAGLESTMEGTKKHILILGFPPKKLKKFPDFHDFKDISPTIISAIDCRSISYVHILEKFQRQFEITHYIIQLSREPVAKLLHSNASHTGISVEPGARW